MTDDGLGGREPVAGADEVAESESDSMIDVQRRDGTDGPDVAPIVVDAVRVVAITAVLASSVAAVAPWFGGLPRDTPLDAGPIPLVLIALVVASIGLMLVRRVGREGGDGLPLGVATGGAVLFSALTASGAQVVATSSTAGLGFYAALVATIAWWVLAGALVTTITGAESPDQRSVSTWPRVVLGAGAVLVVVGSALPPASTSVGVTDWVFVEGERSGIVNASTLLWLASVLVAVVPVARNTRRAFLAAVGCSSVGVVAALGRVLELHRPSAAVGAPMLSLDIHGVAAIGIVIWASGVYLGRRVMTASNRSSLVAVPWRRVARFGAALALIGGLIGAFAAGVMIGEREQPDPAAVPTPVVVEVPPFDVDPVDAVPDRATDMPNLIGLTEQTARAVITDLTATGEIPVVVNPVGSAGEPGFVIGQSPPPGADEPVAVTLTVGSPVAMPPLIGESERDAVELLEDIGARVVVTRRYDPDASPGTVLDSAPSDGDVPDEVTLTVASPPSSTFLDLLDHRQSRCPAFTGDELVATQRAERGFACDPRTNSPASVEFVLSRRARTLEFSVGFADGSDLESRADVVVLLDGQIAESRPLVFDVLESFEIDVSGAVQLAIEVRDTTPEDAVLETASTVVLVEPIVTGSVDDLSELEVP